MWCGGEQHGHTVPGVGSPHTCTGEYEGVECVYGGDAVLWGEK